MKARMLAMVTSPENERMFPPDKEAFQKEAFIIFQTRFFWRGYVSFSGEYFIL